jgi:hypothetical protein
MQRNEPTDRRHRWTKARVAAVVAIALATGASLIELSGSAETSSIPSSAMPRALGTRSGGEVMSID